MWKYKRKKEKRCIWTTCHLPLNCLITFPFPQAHGEERQWAQENTAKNYLQYPETGHFDCGTKTKGLRWPHPLQAPVQEYKMGHIRLTLPKYKNHSAFKSNEDQDTLLHTTVMQNVFKAISQSKQLLYRELSSPICWTRHGLSHWDYPYHTHCYKPKSLFWITVGCICHLFL